jgi:hypothetical protein
MHRHALDILGQRGFFGDVSGHDHARYGKVCGNGLALGQQFQGRQPTPAS